MPPKSAIPAGYTFLDVETFISKKAYEMVEGLLKQAANRNPDAFDMYIYNGLHFTNAFYFICLSRSTFVIADFYSYAILDLIDKTLTAAHSKITKKDYDEGYYILEALTIFIDRESEWLMCDDDERVEVTNKVYAAAVITLMRALDKDGRLDVIHFPALECFLKGVARWCGEMKDNVGGSDYDLVCKAIGRRLFKDKPEGDVAIETARVEEWINGLKATEQAELRREMKAMQKEAKKPWYAGGKSHYEHSSNPDFVLSRMWKEYKQHLATVPKKPLRGPGNWDITKWTAAQRKTFEFAGLPGDEDDY